MKFGPAPLDEARGAIMAHSHRVGERMIRKGSVLDEAALAALQAAGWQEVICARLEPGDVPEDLAAGRLAEPLVSPLLARTRAATGRVNLAAGAPGLLCIDRARIDRLNSIHASLTIGTLPDCSVVAAKDLVATIKIIPFAVPGAVLAEAEALARQGGSESGACGHRTARGEGKRNRQDHRSDRAACGAAWRHAAAGAAVRASGKRRGGGAGRADRRRRRPAAGGGRIGGGRPARRGTLGDRRRWG